MVKRGPSKGHGGRTPLAEKGLEARATTVCAKLSAGEAKLFERLRVEVERQRRADGETSKLTPSGLLRTLVIREANRLGVAVAPQADEATHATTEVQ